MCMISQVVLILADSLLGMGYCITIDNFYESLKLAHFLITKETEMYGTLRSNTKYLPREFRTKNL